METINIGHLAIGLAVIIALLIIGHFVPVPYIRRRTSTFEASKLPSSVIGLITRYAYGVASLLAGIFVWLAIAGQFWVIAGLAVMCITGGLVVVIAYVWDWVEYHVRRSREIERSEQLTRPEVAE